MDVANTEHENWSRLSVALVVALGHLKGRRLRGTTLNNKKNPKSKNKKAGSFPPGEIRYVQVRCPALQAGFLFLSCEASFHEG